MAITPIHLIQRIQNYEHKPAPMEARAIIADLKQYEPSWTEDERKDFWRGYVLSVFLMDSEYPVTISKRATTPIELILKIEAKMDGESIIADLKSFEPSWPEEERRDFWRGYTQAVFRIEPGYVLSRLATASDLIIGQLKLPSVQKKPCTAMRTTNDFGAEVRMLRFAPAEDKKYRVDLIENMKEIAAFEGFILNIGREFFFVRDAALELPNGQRVFCSSKTEKLEQASKMSFAKGIYFRENGASRTRCPSLWDIGFSMVRDRMYVTKELCGIVKEFDFAIEGGNVFTLTNLEGKRKVLIGEDHRTIIHADLRLRKFFKHCPKAIQKIEQNLSKEKILEVAEEMYSMGMIGDGKGFIPDFEKLPVADDGPPINFRKLAIQKGVIEPFALKEITKELKTEIAVYIAEQQMIPKMLSEGLNVPVEDIHFIPQIAYHLDAFLTPGPNRSIFIQDQQTCIELLEAIESQANLLSLTKNDRVKLSQYLKFAKQLNGDFKSLVVETKKKLTEAGFNVIPAPGFFVDVNWRTRSDPRSHIFNFMNGISGWSKRNRRPYFVTMGAHVGDRLGRVFMDLFESFLKKYQPDLKVYFVGYDPKNPTDYSSAMEWWNSPLDEDPPGGAGVHCLSQETNREDHKYD